MKILIFSWRDIKNPKSGGAEIFTHEIAKRWIKMGQEVFLISARFPKGKPQETIDGVKIFRPALFNRYSPFDYLSYLLKTRSFYQKNFKGKIDVAIDQVHGLPLFAPFYVKEKVIIFPLEVAQEIWRYEIPFPFWFFGWFLEFAYIKLFRNRPFLTISPSTAQDLKKLGVKNINVIIPGINLKPKKSLPKKSEYPLLVSLGRLTPMKRIEETLLAFQIIVQKFPQAQLYIIGRGQRDYLEKLKVKGRKLRVANQVTFPGFISESQKEKLLSEAWLLVSTSVREGWGLSVIEAAACGTPAVVYKVPGLIDSVKDKETGLICQENSPENLAENLIKLLTDQKLRLKLSENALDYSRDFSWEKAAEEGLAILNKIL